MTPPRFDLKGDIVSGAAARLTGFLDNHKDQPVLLVINSPGGDAMEGAAMMAEIERHGRVCVWVQGYAASAATLPMVAANEVIIHPAAMVMIHEPASAAQGTADEFRLHADALDKITQTYAEAYARHTGQPVHRISAWMKDETWLNAEEAVTLGFCDRLETTSSVPLACADLDFAKFSCPPEALVSLAIQNGWVANPPAKLA